MKVCLSIIVLLSTIISVKAHRQLSTAAKDWRTCLSNPSNAGYWSDTSSQLSGSCWTTSCTPVTGNEVCTSSFSLSQVENFALCPKDPTNWGEQVYEFEFNNSSLNFSKTSIPGDTVWWYQLKVKGSEVKQIVLKLSKYK